MPVVIDNRPRWMRRRRLGAVKTALKLVLATVLILAYLAAIFHFYRLEAPWGKQKDAATPGQTAVKPQVYTPAEASAPTARDITTKTVTVTKTITATTARTVTATTTVYSKEQIIRAVVDRINEYRAKEGTPPVKYMETKSAQFRAEYMHQHNIFSHYDKEGRHPAYYWTKLDGGLYGFEENAGWFRCIGDCINPLNDTLQLIYFMVYEDAFSLWGHRDSILDPCNNYVSIGLSYDSYSLYITVHMIAKWVEWIEPPRYENGVFRAKGVVVEPRLKPESENGYTFYQVFIYRDVPNPSNVHRHSYSVGDLYAGVLPKDYPGYYTKTKTIRAEKLYARRVESGWLFEVEFLFRPEEPGLYTIVMFAKNNLGVSWKPMSPGGEARLERCELFAYTVEK